VEELQKDLAKAGAEHWIPDFKNAEANATDKDPSDDEME